MKGWICWAYLVEQGSSFSSNTYEYPLGIIVWTVVTTLWQAPSTWRCLQHRRCPSQEKSIHLFSFSELPRHERGKNCRLMLYKWEPFHRVDTSLHLLIKHPRFLPVCDSANTLVCKIWLLSSRPGEMWCAAIVQIEQLFFDFILYSVIQLWRALVSEMLSPQYGASGL